jgi:hypothetical protein
MIEIPCPKCGNYEVIVEAQEVSLLQSVVSFLTLGVYNPWKRRIDDSIDNFNAGLARATCLVCAHKFNVVDQGYMPGTAGHDNIRPEVEADLAAYEEREQEALENNLPL